MEYVWDQSDNSYFVLCSSNQMKILENNNRNYPLLIKWWLNLQMLFDLLAQTTLDFRVAECWYHKTSLKETDLELIWGRLLISGTHNLGTQIQEK